MLCVEKKVYDQISLENSKYHMPFMESLTVH